MQNACLQHVNATCVCMYVHVIYMLYSLRLNFCGSPNISQQYILTKFTWMQAFAVIRMLDDKISITAQSCQHNLGSGGQAVHTQA